MQVLLNIADRLSKIAVVGGSKSDPDLSDTVKLLNDRMEQILQFLKYDENNKPKPINLFRMTEEEQMQNLTDVQSMSEQSPILLLPFAYHTAMSHISRKARTDLTLFATDFRTTHGGLSFTLSTSSFGSAHSYSHPETEKQRVSDMLARLNSEGYVIRKEKSDRTYVLQDCDSNRLLLQHYCEQQLHAVVTSFKTHFNIIRSLDCHIKSKDVLTVNNSCDKPDEGDPATKDIITADEAAQIQKNIKELGGVLSFYAMAESRDDARTLALANADSIVYMIEKLTGVHASIYERHEQKSAPIRSKYQQIHETEDDIRQVAVETIGQNSGELYSDVHEMIQRFLDRAGLYVHNLYFLPHQAIRLEIMPADFPMYRSNNIKVIDPLPENTDTIMSAIQEILPHAELYGQTFMRSDGKMQIRQLDIDIHDVTDLQVLQNKMQAELKHSEPKSEN